jgi:hypothetical protein
MIKSRRKKTVMERFYEKVKKTDTCWLWTGTKRQKENSRAYGVFYHTIGFKKTVRLPAHRVSYELHYGIDPEKKLVCHKCDNPPCVNPDHLFLGDTSDNAIDMVLKGRGADTKGELNPQSKLTADIVLKIVEDVSSGLSQIQAAKKYGISQCHISDILCGTRWTHITNLPKKISPGNENGHAFGEGHGNAVLTDEKVLKMRDMYKTGNFSHAILADIFNVSLATVWNILNYKNWRHV